MSATTSRIWLAAAIASAAMSGCATQDPDPTSRSAWSVTALGVNDLRVNEFNANQDSGNADPAYQTEWVEIYNLGSTAVDMTGLVMDDISAGGSSPKTIGSNVTSDCTGDVIDPGGFCVVSGFGAYFNNTGDDVRLLQSNGSTVIDATSYTSSAKGATWARQPDGTGGFVSGTHTQGSSNGAPPGCGGGPACSGGEVCCNNACTVPLCGSDADCNSGDICQNDNTCVASCSTPPGTSNVKVMTYNVKEGGLDPGWKDVVKDEDADIIIFVETQDWGTAKLNSLLSEFNGYFGPDYEGHAEPNAPPFGGTAIMSRFSITSVTQVGSLTLDDNSSWTPVRDFMIWTLDVGGTEVKATGVHLKCCSGASNEDQRERDTEGLINWFDANAPASNIIIAGDFNAFSYNDELAGNNLGDLAHGPLEMLLDENPGDAYDTYESTKHLYFDGYRELVPTISSADHTYRISPFNSRIDFIVVNDGLHGFLKTPASVGAGTANDPGSDHWSVDVHLDFGGNPPTCGDSVCDATEDCASCPGDCGTCPTCGDSVCDATEDCTSCPADCGTCPICKDKDEPCSSDEECCSGNCKNRKGSLICR